MVKILMPLEPTTKPKTDTDVEGQDTNLAAP